MPVYILAGPAVALIGIISIFFVMRHKSVQTKSMYSSRRSQIERKVKAARQRTLAPRGRGGKPPTAAEIAAAGPMPSAPAYEAPAAPRTPSWDMPAAPAPVYEPPPMPPSEPAEPSAPVPPQPEWTPAPAEAVWTPAPAQESPAAPAPERGAPAEPAVVPAGGGASWSIVGSDVPATEGAPAKGKDKDKKGRKEKQAATGSAWELSSGAAPGEEADEEPRPPSAAMAVAQYAVLVVGLVMVLIGVLVMVANSKVT
jgi:hypothetical protein